MRRVLMFRLWNGSTNRSGEEGTRRRFRMPSPAMVVAMLALLVSTAGTSWGVRGAISPGSAKAPAAATGGCAVFKVSNPACHFPAWDSRDIINNSLQSVDIKNGTLQKADFSRGTVSFLKAGATPT